MKLARKIIEPEHMDPNFKWPWTSSNTAMVAVATVSVGSVSYMLTPAIPYRKVAKSGKLLEATCELYVKAKHVCKGRSSEEAMARLLASRERLAMRQEALKLVSIGEMPASEAHRVVRDWGN